MKIMIITIVWSIGFMLGMLGTVPILCMHYILKLFIGIRKADKYTHYFTTLWARLVVLTTGSTVTVIGMNNISNASNVCFISNHESYFDIPLLMGWLNKPVGFVAKQELRKIPVLSHWITAIHSAFIDRSNPRKAIDSINLAAEHIRQGHAVAIFPEGSRNKSDLVSEFKTGSLRLATSSNAIIQPITIIGTRQIFEAEKRIRKSKVILIIHKAIHTSDDVYQDKQVLVSHIHDIISESYRSASSNSG